jgi:bifunctional non-homologous end joining protein LigD
VGNDRTMDEVPTTVAFPAPLPAERAGPKWRLAVDGVELEVSNLDKLFWGPEGYTKADLLAYYYNAARWLLPYLRDRPLTLKRMPDGADGDFFYEKQAPSYTPPWVATAPVTARDGGRTIDYLLAQDRPAMLWLANLGCIEFHPWHSRVDRIGRPDYAFFDLDPMGTDFATVRHVALLVRTALDQLGLRGYPRTSGATGMQVYIPLDRVHDAAQVRDFVGRVCRLINRADPERTTMEWAVSQRTGKVFLDHSMNTEGRNIAATYSLRPERQAPVAAPLRWEEVEGGVEPTDFTIAAVWRRLEQVGDLFRPVLDGEQDLRGAMAAVGMDPEAEPGVAGHVVGTPPSGRRSPDEALAAYARKRDFTRTPEPPARPPPARAPADVSEPGATAPGEPARPRFVVQHHLATRLHHDLRLERGGSAPSWAVPKGLPDVPGVRHLAVRTEDHPLEYLSFEGDIPAGEYGAGPMRIWDRGRCELLEWTDGKVTVRLDGGRHRGTYHLFRTGDDPSQWMVIRRDEPAPGELPDPPPAYRPMLATTSGQPFDDPQWLFELKWDGVRALATCMRPGRGDDASTTLVSRQGNDITAAYPELASLWERVLARNAVLDGEIVALAPGGVPSFERLQQRMHVRDAAAIERLRARVPVTYMVFDLLWADGEPLIGLPLTERLARLDAVAVPGGSIQRSDVVAEHGRALYAAVRERGLEGIMAKHAASVYRPGRRSPEWRKVKSRREVDCVIGGWLPSTTPARPVGSLLLGLYAGPALRYVGRVGTGFDDAELRRLAPLLAERTSERCPFDEPPVRGRADGPPVAGRWVAPELVCRVEYGEVTARARLRGPSYKGLQPQADPRACVLEDLPEVSGDGRT